MEIKKQMYKCNYVLSFNVYLSARNNRRIRYSMDDRATFDKMFNEWYAQFVYFAYYFINDAEVCRDIVSDAFEYLWRNYEKIEEATAKTYLYTIIRTRCIDYLRKQNIHEEYVEFTAQLTDKMIEGDSQNSDSRVLRIREAMKKLTPYNYHILEACYIHNKKYKEVAEELNVSVAAVHKNIVKALRILREELGQKGNRN